MKDFSESHYWYAAQGMPIGVYAGQTRSIIDAEQAHILPYLQQNLALHVSDDAQAVQQNRMHLLQQLKPYGVKRCVWLNQTHSTSVYTEMAQPILQLRDGDALVTREKGIALMMMTADCLPIVISNADGSEVACAHAGWRGLADGIIESTVAKMQTQPCYAWIGAAISQPNFEVGAEVKAKFESLRADFSEQFQAKANGKYLANLYTIATKKLHALSVTQVTGADRCSYAENDVFYSYRRAAITGRMATFVFIA